MDAIDAISAAMRPLMLDTLGRNQQFDRNHLCGHGHGLTQMPRRGGTHGVVVLDTRRGRHVAHACRSGKDLHLVTERSGGVLGNHQAAVEPRRRAEMDRHRILTIVAAEQPEDPPLGDARDVAEGNFGGIRGDGKRHAVKVAAAENDIRS